MSMALTGLQLALAKGGAAPPPSAMHLSTNLTVRPSDGYPLPTAARPPCLLAILATSRSRVTFATMDAAATTSNRESALWCERTEQAPPRTMDETALPNRPASTSHESTYATPAPSLDMTLAMYDASSALRRCLSTLLSMVDGPILDACQPSAASSIRPYISSLRAAESSFESRTPISLSLLIPPRPTATPATTSGPIIEPRPASSTPQTIIGPPAAGHLLNRVRILPFDAAGAARPAARQACAGAPRRADMSEKSDSPPVGLDDDLPEGLDGEAREWIRRVMNMNDEDARKAMLEWRADNALKSAWSRSHEEFLKELP